MVAGGVLPAISRDREMGGWGAYLSLLLPVIIQSLALYFNRLGFVGGLWEVGIMGKNNDIA
jgi:hypothetical protein